jgi:DNA-binding transcriptional regulator/RsmH inhibitor MraZ
MQAVGLVKDIVLVGANNKIEIWSAEEWNRMELEDDDADILVKGLEKYELFI